jgi:hypothetical protein
MAAEPFESTLPLARMRRGLLLGTAVAGALTVATIIALLALPIASRYALMIAVPALLSAFFAAVALAAFGVREKAMSARVRADERGLSADGALVLPRARIETGYLQPPALGKADAPQVRLIGRRYFERVAIAVHDEAEGTRLLETLGLDPSRAVAHFRVRQGIFASKRAQAVLNGILTAFGYQAYVFLSGPIKLPFTAVILVLLALNALPSRVSIGADGVLVASTLRRRFYSFANVARVTATAWGIALVTKQGKEIELRTRSREAKGAKIHDPTTMAIVARIEAGIARMAARGEAGLDPAALVARGAQTYEEWVAALRGLRSGGGYRAAAVAEETLWRVAEDPKVDASTRVGAALALRDDLDEAGRARGDREARRGG